MERALIGPWGRLSRFGDGRSPAGRAETASRDGECPTTVGSSEGAAKREESAVEPAERRPALPATHEAQPAPGAFRAFPHHSPCPVSTFPRGPATFLGCFRAQSQPFLQTGHVSGTKSKKMIVAIGRSDWTQAILPGSKNVSPQISSSCRTMVRSELNKITIFVPI